MPWQHSERAKGKGNCACPQKARSVKGRNWHSSMYKGQLFAAVYVTLMFLIFWQELARWLDSTMMDLR
jgi:hypothetical protein